MLIRGVCTSTFEKSDYVVKYLKAHRMCVEASCRELIAAFIAKELGIDVAEPVLINISSEFVDTVRGYDSYQVASKSTGLNYGSKYFGQGFIEFINRQNLNEEQYNQAQKIFAFDMLISNPDRRIEKHNMLTDGEKIMIFDHELAFSSVNDIFKPETPWLINNDRELRWIKNHYFHPILKHKRHDFKAFVDELDRLDKKFWDKSYTLIPTEWQTPNLDDIKNNISKVINNKEVFLQELYKVLI